MVHLFPLEDSLRKADLSDAGKEDTERCNRRNQTEVRRYQQTSENGHAGKLDQIRAGLSQEDDACPTDSDTAQSTCAAGCREYSIRVKGFQRLSFLQEYVFGGVSLTTVPSNFRNGEKKREEDQGPCNQGKNVASAKLYTTPAKHAPEAACSRFLGRSRIGRAFGASPAARPGDTD